MNQKKSLTAQEIFQLIEKEPNLTTKALICFQYALNCRIGELLPYKHKFRSGAVTETKGILKANIHIYPEYIEIEHIPSFKNNTEKNIQIPVEEKLLYETITEYLKYCPEQVFPFHQAKARKLLRDSLGYSSHILRHSRTTVLSQALNPYELAATRGDKSIYTSVIYVHTNPATIREKIKGIIKTV